MNRRLFSLLILGLFSARNLRAEDESTDSDVADRIQSLGGKLLRNSHRPGNPVVGVSFDATIPRSSYAKLPGANLFRSTPTDNSVTDDDLGILSQVALLESLSFTACQRITDAAFKQIIQFKNLKSLSFTDCQQISGEGLAELRDLNRLTKLAIDKCNQIEDGDLPPIAEIRSLTVLKLSGTRITDEGMQELGKLTRLKALDVSQNQITDVGLRQLVELKALDELQVIGCRKITKAACKKLNAEIPRLTIIR